MNTWNDYKEYVRATDPEAAEIITAAELEAESIPVYSGERDIAARSLSSHVTEQEPILYAHNSYSLQTSAN